MKIPRRTEHFLDREAKMETQQYYETIQRVSELVDGSKDYPAAVALLQTIIESDLPALDRSIMSVNMATVCDKMGHESHALAWYDHGIALEEPFMRCFVALHKAAYLAEKGRKDEAAAIYQRFLAVDFLTTPEREDIKQRLAPLTG